MVLHLPSLVLGLHGLEGGTHAGARVLTPNLTDMPTRQRLAAHMAAPYLVVRLSTVLALISVCTQRDSQSGAAGDLHVTG